MTRMRRRRLSVTIAVLALVLAVATWIVTTRPTPGSAEASRRGPTSTSGEPSAMPTIAPTPPPAATTSGVYGVSTTGPIPTSVPGDVATDRPVDVGSGSRVVVTYAAWSSDTEKIDASAYVAGVVEDGGTCTVTATSAAATRSAISAASADATTTVCADLVVPWSAADGSPSLVVGYQSATTSAQSDLTTVEVDR